MHALSETTSTTPPDPKFGFLWPEKSIASEAMPLEELPLTSATPVLPDDIAALLLEAGKRCDAFFEAGLDRRYPRYLPSHPEIVFGGLAQLKSSGFLRGNLFCEWGSGFGIATCLASLLGFEAFGIEIEAELAERSTQLAGDLNIPVEILCTSYLPEGYEECEGVGGKDLLRPEATSCYEASVDTTPLYDGLDPGEVDLFFVYPWPGQEEFMMDLFEAVAGEDAILLLHHADASLTAYRQVVA
jgi:hypothetical protein